MGATFYDANTPPEARAWCAIDEWERVRLVKNYLLELRPRVSNAKGLAILLTIAESQLASGFGPARRALERLQAQGLTRYEGLKAIAFTLRANPVYAMGESEEPSTRDRQLALNSALDALAAESWRRRTGDEV